MKKSVCGMVAIHQALLVVGGYGSPSKSHQPLAQYDEEDPTEGVDLTNEHHLHRLGTGELRSMMICVVCAWRISVLGSLLKDGGSLMW